MPNATQGSVASLWRYPVKSMLGEELTATEVTERGLLGDRAYALVDSADGKAATAKNPKKWPTLFAFRATFIEPPRPDASVPPVRITLPDGTTVTSQQANLNELLSNALNRTVNLNAAGRALGVGDVVLGRVALRRGVDDLPHPSDLDHLAGLQEVVLALALEEDRAALVLHQVPVAAERVGRDALWGGRFQMDPLGLGAELDHRRRGLVELLSRLGDLLLDP